MSIENSVLNPRTPAECHVYKQVKTCVTISERSAEITPTGTF